MALTPAVRPDVHPILKETNFFHPFRATSSKVNLDIVAIEELIMGGVFCHGTMTCLLFDPTSRFVHLHALLVTQIHVFKLTVDHTDHAKMVHALAAIITRDNIVKLLQIFVQT